MGQRWKIGELAKLTGLSIRTLRFYDQIGLFSPSGQTESGHRLYSDSDLSLLHRILSLKELGLSLEEVKSVLAGEWYSPAEIVAMQMARIKEQIKRQSRLLEQLGYVSKQLTGNSALAPEDFANLLQAMRRSHEKPVIERKMSWEDRLDKLADFLVQEEKTPNPIEEDLP